MRLVFVVGSREDIQTAVRLYTHVCGGAVGVILPLPYGAGEEELFRHAIFDSDPDAVFTSNEEVGRRVVELLRGYSFPVSVLGADQVDEHCQGINRLSLASGQIPHVLTLLEDMHPSGLADSSIRTVDLGGRYDAPLELHFGSPGDRYRKALTDRWGAKRLRSPEAIDQFIKTIVTAAARATPASATVGGLSLRAVSSLTWVDGTPLLDVRTRSDQSLFLFLDDGADLHIPAAFWNSRRVSGTSNKFLLPRDEFLASPDVCLGLLSTERPLAEVIVFARGGRENAEEIRGQVAGAMSRVKADVAVSVYFDRFGFEVERGAAYARGSETMTRVRRPDGSVRFSVAAPTWAGRSSAFGYDASVVYETGTRLSLPNSIVTTVLLMNEAERIRRVETNQKGLGALWLNPGPAVRAHERGVAGLTSPGQEVRFYLHDDEFFIGRVLRQRGFRVQPNQHTHFAQGFIRRFGGFDECMSLVDAGGVRILSALDQHRAHQCGLTDQQITAFVKRAKDGDEKRARQAVEEYLPKLLAAGLVRRGAALECSHCRLRDWYAIDALHEFMECTGCAQTFQLPRHAIGYHYRANELARRVIHEGGQAVFQAAANLRAIEPAGALQFGGDVFREGERTNAAEVDLLLLSADTLALVECKAWSKLEGDSLSEVEASLKRLVALAPDLGAGVVLLGVVTEDAPGELYSMVQGTAEEAAERGVAVHLMVGSMLHMYGELSPTVFTEIGLSGLMLDPPAEVEPVHVGSLATSIGVGASQRAPGPQTVAAWEGELLA
jgi:hypothetical protein